MLHDENRKLPDIGLREQISLWPLAVLALIMGVASPLWMKSIDPAVASITGPTANARSVSTTTTTAGGQK
jgi:NADH-quinone oxidoreductase subunit M